MLQLTNCRQSILFPLLFVVFRSALVAGQNNDENDIPFLGVRLGVRQNIGQTSVPFSATANQNQSWFEQKLDHFDRFNSATWQQRFFTNDEFFNKTTRDGPIFLMIGGEQSINDGFINSGMWIEWAEKYSALCFQVEHRYYGNSFPTPDVSTANLKYLSSEQALADLANFISYQKTALNLIGNKWIVFGGSYSGSLAAWFRLKYPYLAHGAVASSAPMLAKKNFKEYYEVVSNALKTSKQGAECTNSIQQGINALVEMTQSGTYCGNIKSLFNLCKPVNCTDGLQVSYTFEALVSALFANNIQYHNDSPNSTTPNIDKLCNIMTNSSIGPSVYRLAAIGDIMMKLNDIECMHNDYHDAVKYYSTSTSWDHPSVSGGSRQWFYQTCTEFGFLQTSDSTNQPFGNRFPLNFVSRRQCTDVFGPNFNDQFISRAIDWTNIAEGGLDLVLNRTVFTNGSLDPWSALGITTNQTGNLAIFIKGSAHCADMLSTSSEDSPAMKAAKLQIEDNLRSWILEN